MNDYLARRRKELGLTQKEVADAVGVSEATVSRWESGEIANMRRDRIAALAKVLRSSASFVMTGERDENTIPTGFSPLPDMDTLPRVGRIACGDPILAEQNIEGYDSVPSGWRATFTLICVGDSMAPRIQDGDLVAIRQQKEVENGEIAAVRIGDEATLKRVYFHDDYIELRPENPAYSSIIRRREEMNDVSIEGRAVGFCRAL